MATLLPNGLERKSVDIAPELMKKIKIAAIEKNITAKELMERWIQKEAEKIK